MTLRMADLYNRLESVRAGVVCSQLLQPEDLYRRVSDKQTMGSVVGELRRLGELESFIDVYILGTRRTSLVLVSQCRASWPRMRRVRRRWVPDQASQAVHRMDTIESLMVLQLFASQ
jgi:chemosensory pili system protein ChpA (sensor histidine kinase/response regulator)